MYVCVHIYVYMYVCTCVCIYLCMRVCMYIICVLICVCMYACICVYVRMFVCVCMYICMCVFLTFLATNTVSANSHFTVCRVTNKDCSSLPVHSSLLHMTPWAYSIFHQMHENLSETNACCSYKQSSSVSFTFLDLAMCNTYPKLAILFFRYQLLLLVQRYTHRLSHEQ